MKKNDLNIYVNRPELEPIYSAGESRSRDLPTLISEEKERNTVRLESSDFGKSMQESNSFAVNSMILNSGLIPELKRIAENSSKQIFVERTGLGPTDMIVG